MFNPSPVSWCRWGHPIIKDEYNNLTPPTIKLSSCRAVVDEKTWQDPRSDPVESESDTHGDTAGAKGVELKKTCSQLPQKVTELVNKNPFLVQSKSRHTLGQTPIFESKNIWRDRIFYACISGYVASSADISVAQLYH